MTVREYRRGDDLRRVHWRSSARVGELMVRREEQPWQSRATLFLDNRVRSHRGQGIASSLEAAVSVAASIAVHLTRRGFAVRLVTAAGEDPSSAWHLRDSDLNTAPLLEALAVLAPTQTPQLDTGWLTEHGGGGLVVAVVGGVEPMDTPVLRRMHAHAGSALAVALDVDAWVSGGAGTGGAAGLLTQQGWRAVPLRPARPARVRVGRARPRLDAERPLPRRCGAGGGRVTMTRRHGDAAFPRQPGVAGHALDAGCRHHLGGAALVARLRGAVRPLPRAPAAPRRGAGRLGHPRALLARARPPSWCWPRSCPRAS